MAIRALYPGIPAAAAALGIGSIIRPGVGVSAAIGILAVVASFVANALALGWARTISLTAIPVVAYSGFIVRLAFVVGVFFALKAGASWFSPPAFGGALFAMIPLALYEAYLARRGPLAELLVPDVVETDVKERA
jgi:hypothetical protein